MSDKYKVTDVRLYHMVELEILTALSLLYKYCLT